jgi:hypothetical protein
MKDGGWYMCPEPMIGTTFGVYTSTNDFYSADDYLTFIEVMAYSQEAIQMNALLVSF